MISDFSLMFIVSLVRYSRLYFYLFKLLYAEGILPCLNKVIYLSNLSGVPNCKYRKGSGGRGGGGLFNFRH